MISKSFYFKAKNVDDVEINILDDDEIIQHFSNASRGFFNYGNVEYEIKKKISDSNSVEIVLSADADDYLLDSFDIQIIDKQITLNKSIISKYIPTIPYTKTLSSALYDLADNNKILPMIDVETADRFENYKNDESINFEHFLDISLLKYTTNKDKINEIKAERKKLKIEGKKIIPDIPLKQEAFAPLQQKIELFLSVEGDKKNNIIPVFLWNHNSNKNDFNQFYNDLRNSGYNNFALRITAFSSFKEDIIQIKSLNNSFKIILDMDTNFDDNYIASVIDEIKHHFDDITYLGAHFSMGQISIPREQTYRYYIHDNYPILVYFNLIKKFPDLKYGDYCGFDRKTISSMPSGGRPTARIIICSLSKDNKILVYRSWDNKDNNGTSIGYANSMTKLLKDLQDGKFDNINKITFLDINKCDADIALKSFYPKNTTPGVMKTLCIRHNIFSVKTNFM